MKPVIRYGLPYNIDFKTFTKAKTVVPDWYKNHPKESKEGYKSFKYCLPFLDTFTSGYMVLTPCDLKVSTNENGEKSILWNPEFEPSSPPITGPVNFSANNIPAPPGFYNEPFVFKLPVSLHVPVGYSYLVTQPINRYDLPFAIVGAIIDGGYSLSPFGNISFFLNASFEGIIPQGTPVAQIIPFRQEKWVSKEDPQVIAEGVTFDKSSNSKFSGWYKKAFWIKKSYE